MGRIKYSLYVLKRDGIRRVTDKVLLKIKRRFAPGEFRNIPRQLHIETTNFCNLSCEYCVLRKNVAVKTTMKLSEFKLLMPYIKFSDAVALSGLAEPLMNKE